MQVHSHVLEVTSPWGAEPNFWRIGSVPRRLEVSMECTERSLVARRRRSEVGFRGLLWAKTHKMRGRVHLRHAR
jgi:hypothetical protein